MSGFLPHAAGDAARASVDRISHSYNFGSICNGGSRCGASVHHHVATSPPEPAQPSKPPLNGLKPRPWHNDRALPATTDGSPQALGRMLGLKVTPPHQSRDAAAMCMRLPTATDLVSDTSSKRRCWQSRTIKFTTSATSLTATSAAADAVTVRSSTYSTSCDANVDEKDSQLRRRRPRTHSYAARRNEQAGERHLRSRWPGACVSKRPQST